MRAFKLCGQSTQDAQRHISHHADAYPRIVDRGPAVVLPL